MNAVAMILLALMVTVSAVEVGLRVLPVLYRALGVMDAIGIGIFIAFVWFIAIVGLLTPSRATSREPRT